MKTKFFLCTIFVLSTALSALSQIPQGYSYQAIARGSDGKELVNTPLQVKLSVLSDTTGFKISGSGTYVWEEQQSATTNSFGLFTLTFGNPLATKIQGTAASFSAIDWKAQPLFMGVKINPNGAGWKILGSAKLWSVPYSMVSGDLSGPVKKLAVSGTTTVMDEALFEVKNKDGQTVFAVYNEGVRIYVDDGVAKGVKGGFAIGSFGTGKAPSKPLLIVDPDSIRAYITTDAVKGKKGGFAIGGFDKAKVLEGEEYLRVTRDSTRIYVKEQAKGVKGGFAIGSFSPAKAGVVTSFTSLTPQNYFIGHEAGKSNTTGLYNSFIGYQAGLNNNEGSSNSLLGFQSGYNNTTGNSNLLLGYRSGYSNTNGSNNSFLGYLSGRSNTTGMANTFIGSYSGNQNVNGSNNTFLGFYSGNSNSSGSGNNFMGTNSGFSNTSGKENVFIGTESGYSNTTGNFNSFIGYHAGRTNTRGRYNVLLGYEAGLSSDTSFNTFVGYQVGRANTTGTNNVFMGYRAGYINTISSNNVAIGVEAAGSSNPSRGDNVSVGLYAGWANNSYSCVFLGTGAGQNAVNGRAKIMIGPQAGYNADDAPYSIFIGGSAGLDFSTGYENIFIGADAGKLKQNGSRNIQIGTGTGAQGWEPANTALSDDNVIIGYRSAAAYWISNCNVFLGKHAGYLAQRTGYSVYIGSYAGYNARGTGNVFIGDSAGYNETGSNRLYIANGKNNVSLPLIYGEFDNKLVKINGSLHTETILSLGQAAGGTAGKKWNIFYNSNDAGDYGLSFTRVANGTNYLTLGNGGTSYFPAGNIGIGTSTPAFRLDVVGRARFQTGSDGSAGAWFNNAANSSVRTFIGQFDDNYFGIYGVTSQWGFLMNTNSGNVAIGTTSPDINVKFHVKGNAAVFNLEGTDHCYMQFYPDTWAGGRKAYFGYPSSTINDLTLSNEIAGGDIILMTSTTGYVGIGTSAPAYKLQVGVAGDGSQARANAWNLLSDIRFKADLEPLVDPLGKISGLSGFYFNWNTGTDKSRQFGLSAQEVEKVLPEVVSKGDDGYLSVDYGKLVPLLIEGMKAQQSQIDKLERKVEELQAAMAAQGGK